MICANKIAFCFPFCRYKSLSFLSGNKRDIVMERVFDILEKRETEIQRRTETELLPVKQEPVGPPQSQDSQQQDPSQPTRKKQRKSLTRRMAGDVVDLTKPAATLRKEVAEYQSAMVRAGVGPLEWWSRFAVSFQSVASLAREYLSIPPTEVSN